MLIAPIMTNAPAPMIAALKKLVESAGSMSLTAVALAVQGTPVSAPVLNPGPLPLPMPIRNLPVAVLPIQASNGVDQVDGAQPILRAPLARNTQEPR